MTNRFIDGGATGISLLISNTTEIPLSVLLVLVNAPFVFIGFRTLEKFWDQYYCINRGTRMLRSFC